MGGGVCMWQWLFVLCFDSTGRRGVSLSSQHRWLVDGPRRRQKRRASP